MRHRLLVLALLGGSWGCTGATLGVRAPGADTFMGSGAIAVDHRTDLAFVVGSYALEEGTARERQERRLFAIDPDGGEPRLVSTSRPGADPRLLFPESGVLSMTELSEGREQLTLYDRDTLRIKTTRTIPHRYWGTRMSPSRKWVAVADNDDDALPIHLIDAVTLEPRPVPHGGTWLEAMWMTRSDRLVGAIFHDPSSAAEVRIVVWPIADLSERAFATDETGAWASPELDITVPGKIRDACLSFTWIGVSPTDHHVVIPVRDAATAAYELLVVDVQAKTQRIVAGAKGPVSFTGDGRTVVSYEWAEDRRLPSELCGVGTRLGASTSPGKEPAPDSAAPPPTPQSRRERLLLIDVDTLETRRVDPAPLASYAAVPPAGKTAWRFSGFNFHVVDTTVVVAPAGEGDEQSSHPPLFVFDVATPDAGTVIVARTHLYELIERPVRQDLWLVSHDNLERIDLAKRRLERIALGFETKHINYLPIHDWLVLDRLAPWGPRPSVVFFDPEARKIMREARLPE